MTLGNDASKFLIDIEGQKLNFLYTKFMDHVKFRPRS